MTGKDSASASLLTFLTTIALAAGCSSANEPDTVGSGGTPGHGGTPTAGSGMAGSAAGIPGAAGKAGFGGASGSSSIGSAGASGGPSSAGNGVAGSTAGGSSGAAGVPGSGGAAVAGKSGMGSGGAMGGAGGASGGPNIAGGGATSGGVPSAGETENSGADCMVSAGELKKNEKLPDPFAMNDGKRIGTKAEWRCRRNEIKKDLEKYEIGPKPSPPEVTATVAGSMLNVKVTTDAGSITLTSTVSGSGSCVAIGMNGSSRLINGCVQIPFSHDQVVTYAQSSTRNQSDPFYKVYPDLWGKIGNYSAWSWGISRLIDGIVQVKDQLKVDTSRIAVHGCSYAGKMALFAGALDERVALTIAQESGGGGINAWRTSQDYATRSRTDVEKIDNTNYSWFLSSMKNLDAYSLPHDHHELIAMIAPRAVVAFGNPDYAWMGDESGYKSVMAAKEVWKAMGIEDHIGFDFSSDHTHCTATSSQTDAARAFVDRFLKGQSANTKITSPPSASGYQLDVSSVIDWTTPTLQ